MSNMSYCRFQNTVIDLRDCSYALEEMMLAMGMDEESRRADHSEGFSDLSRDEASAAIKLIQLARDVIEAYGDDDAVMEELKNARNS